MQTYELINLLNECYINKSKLDRPFVVAIDGLSGAGKTTLVKRIQEQLTNIDVVVIHIDDHIVERNKRYHTGYEEWYEYYSLQWDVEKLSNDLFEKLQSNSDIHLPFYNNSTDTYEVKEIPFTPRSIVLVEGIFLQRHEWRDYLDFVIYIDCPRDIRYKRVLTRDTYIGDFESRLNKYKNRYWLGEDHYLKVVKPMEIADLIINFE
ncbi:kinase [Bacillus sp. 31A1R]|uniref:Kinase n=1 Tax=Robertmurraya mangrovi TaxID=3098077 RepID=A0ABU5IWE2_9BACI|nr:kinase [Bacillus sp. 31A1R]MDZ5471445.1 kinase [Bacillus sp. 31A1R]